MKYYPTLNNLITLDRIPSNLDFLSTSLSNLLDKVYFEDYVCIISPDASEAQYSLKLLIARLEFRNRSMMLFHNNVALVGLGDYKIYWQKLLLFKTRIFSKNSQLLLFKIV